MKVLLIDDDEQIVGSLRNYLALHGCAVDVALDHAAARSLMSTRQYGVVLVDPYLTGGVRMENREMLDAITRLQPKASVIVITGYGSPELARLVSEARLSLLAKPQSVVDLSEKIFGALHVRRETQTKETIR
jgi:DNA-binding NtrC family response regulator